MSGSYRPLVSVVTISFADLAGLQATLPSVWAQRGDFDIQHIVIDGGSGPSVVDYLESQSARLAYWRSSRDGGRYDAMNIGIDRSRGDLIWFMHSGDCFSDAGSIAAGLDALGSPSREEIRSSWGYGRVMLGDRAGTSGRQWGYIPFELQKFALGSEPIPHQAAFFGADLVARLGGYDVDFGIAADQLYMLRAALLRPPATTSRVLCDFDTGGVGSKRTLHDHYRDTRRSWEAAGYRPLRSASLAHAASLCTELSAGVKLLARRAVTR